MIRRIDPVLPAPKQRKGGRIAVQDVFPTLIETAGLSVTLGTDIDGANRWDVIGRLAEQTRLCLTSLAGKKIVSLVRMWSEIEIYTKINA